MVRVCCCTNEVSRGKEAQETVSRVGMYVLSLLVEMNDCNSNDISATAHKLPKSFPKREEREESFVVVVLFFFNIATLPQPWVTLIRIKV